MASVSYHIANLLEKMTSSDKDFRFMAANDLMAELQKDSIKLDDDSERKVVKMLLKLLEDKNGEVQNLAVRCLGPLVNKVKEFQVEGIVDALCTNMLSEKEQLRDISSIGLKTVINELPPSSTTLAANICKKITGRLTSAIGQQEDVAVQLEALDILGDLLSRFGSLLTQFHPSIQEALLPQLASPRLAVRKRTIIALGYLVLSSSPALFMHLIDFLVRELKKNSSMSTTRTYIQCLGAITRQAGHRVGEHLETVIPLIVQFCNEDDDELREYCIQAFESFVRRCPKEVSPHIDSIIKICLKYLCYDPNYNYEDDDVDDAMDVGDEDDEQESEDDEYSDDDDMSWKIRRAAAKCLDAIIATRPEMLSEFYRKISPALVARFKEREENVKADIFHAFITLLKNTRPVASGSLTFDPNAMEEEAEGHPVRVLESQIPTIVSSLHKQLKEKSIKTRQGAFQLLTELILVIPGALSTHVPMLIPGIEYSLGEKNSSSNMKIDTLSFLNTLLVHTSPPSVFHPHVPTLVPPIELAVDDPFYKITSEALLVTQQLVKVIRPMEEGQSSFDPRSFVDVLYASTLRRLKAADLDQEVKERAIASMAQIIANAGDLLSADKLSTALPIFLDRLRNEITRLTTVKSLSLIAHSPLRIQLDQILAGDGVGILSTFLRKNQRPLKLATLTCLDVLVKNYGSRESGGISDAQFATIVKELPPLITEADLHVSQLTLSLLTTILAVNRESLISLVTPPGRGNPGQAILLSPIMTLVRSPLLQGGALNSLLDFLKALVTIQPPIQGLGFQGLMDMLKEPVYAPSHVIPSPNAAFAVHKQAFQSLARCASTLISTSDRSVTLPNVDQLLEDIQNPHTSDSITLFALLTLGEIGKEMDLSGYSQVHPIVIHAFSSQNEEIKTAAAYALGNISVGNLSFFLPLVLREIQTQVKRQYLLLHSLKEIINCQTLVWRSGTALLQPHIPSIWSLLFAHCESSEEGTRNVVAECMGKLALLEPTELLPNLQSQLKSESPLIRSTVVTAIKFTILDQPQKIDSLLRGCIGDFLAMLQDSDLHVRRVALVTFNSAAHNKPSLIRDLLETVLPHLYNETKVRKELIREVEMGPFKHTVDDGLDLRKAAFECMYTLLDTCLDKLDLFEFLNHVEDGLKDHYDIKMLTYLMLVRLANLAPTFVLQRIDRLIEPLRTTCSTKVKANSVKQEYEKQDELKRSAMRALCALISIPDADKNIVVTDFIGQIRANSEMAQMFDAIQKDASSSGNVAAGDGPSGFLMDTS